MCKEQFVRHSIANIYPLIDQISNRCGKKEYGIISGVQVKLTSQRYEVFKRNLTCVKCGLKGAFFAIERQKKEDTDKYHLNLYGIDKDGNEVLMTKDHIVPKAHNGKNHISNYQTMCIKCNMEKGHEISDFVELLEKANIK